MTISEIVVFLRRFPGEHGTNCTGGARGAVVFREAYGVRGACSRCPMCGAVRKREQAPRTPYASRNTTAPLAPPVQFVSCSPGNLREKTTISDIVIQCAKSYERLARRGKDRCALP